MVRTVRLIVGSGSPAAEDAAQDALLDIARGIRGLRDPEAVRGWAFRVATLRAYKAARRERVLFLHRSPAITEELAIHQPDSEAATLKDAFDRLPPRMRAVGVLRLYAGLLRGGIRQGARLHRGRGQVTAARGAGAARAHARKPGRPAGHALARGWRGRVAARSTRRSWRVSCVSTPGRNTRARSRGPAYAAAWSRAVSRSAAPPSRAPRSSGSSTAAAPETTRPSRRPRVCQPWSPPAPLPRAQRDRAPARPAARAGGSPTLRRRPGGRQRDALAGIRPQAAVGVAGRPGRVYVVEPAPAPGPRCSPAFARRDDRLPRPTRVLPHARHRQAVIVIVGIRLFDRYEPSRSC